MSCLFKKMIKFLDTDNQFNCYSNHIHKYKQTNLGCPGNHDIKLDGFYGQYLNKSVTINKYSILVRLCVVILAISFGTASFFYKEIKTYYHDNIQYKLTAETPTTRTYKNRDHIQVFVKNNKGTFELVTDSQIGFTTPKKIAVMYIATGRYINFWKKFYESAEKNLLPKHQKTYFLFTDATNLQLPDNVIKIYQGQESWPNIVLKKFSFYTKVQDKLTEFDYIYYFNANTIFKSEINEEIFPTDTQGLVVTIHPGFYRNFNTKSFTYDRNVKSTAYIPYEEKDGGGVNII